MTSPAALASIARMEARPPPGNKYGAPPEETPTPDTEPTGRKPKVPPCPKCGDPTCLVCTAKDCGLRWCQHHACVVCGFPVEHLAQHPDGRTTDEEWEGRARMAAAKQAAGGMLYDVERRALALFPDPARLTIDGYRRSDGTRPEWAEL